MAECIAGVLFNSYIIIQNILDWRHGKRLSLCDKILVLMAVNNIFLQCDMNVATFLYIVFPGMVQYKNAYYTLSVFLIFQFYFSFWITAGLCIYYCLRIVSFKHHLFVQLKMNISEVVPRFLMLAGMGSFGISLFSIWNIEVSPSSENTNLSTGIFINNILLSPSYKVLTIVVGCCLPFVLTLLSIVLTLSSLITHTQSMRNNKAGFSVPRLDAHIRAARIMILLMVLYTAFYISEVYLLASSLSIDNFWEVMSLIFVLIYPTAQSLTIILGNAKLRLLSVNGVSAVTSTKSKNRSNWVSDEIIAKHKNYIQEMQVDREHEGAGKGKNGATLVVPLLVCPWILIYFLAEHKSDYKSEVQHKEETKTPSYLVSTEE
ncbi:taste receptor type 2 member 9-like [Bufo bufo]|uniref:taste receptor type 2 member 9-like n=1 Tax=Bufo bufo TaxID=8384 RepID=UPI001ABEAFDD|nr:taste receptor type 2 member 9-like [Bufo bufo]